MWSPSCVVASSACSIELLLRVFGVNQRESVHPFLCACFTLIPVIQRTVLKVMQGFVCADSEGGTGHSQGVTVQQRREFVHGAQNPAEDVIQHGQEPEEQRRNAYPSEVECREEHHVEVFVAFVRGVVVAEESFPPHYLRTLSQGSSCK